MANGFNLGVDKGGTEELLEVAAEELMSEEWLELNRNA